MGAFFLERRAAKASGMLRVVRRVSLVVGAFMVLGTAAFIYNGTSTSWRTPEFRVLASAGPPSLRSEVRIMAFNAAKCGFYEGGRFTDGAVVTAELDAIVAAIEREDCDLVHLSEVVLECGPEPIDQVAYVASRAGFAAWAASENYSFGIPFFRIRSGNALLSRWPMTAIETMELAGSKPFWNPSNNRRILWCEVDLGAGSMLVASVRNDSFDLDMNLVQTRQILDYIAGRPAVLAGDFNAEPHDASMVLLRDSRRFVGLVDGPATYPASRPRRRIDHVLAPADWTLIEQKVTAIGSSDHLAVIATFRKR